MFSSIQDVSEIHVTMSGRVGACICHKSDETSVGKNSAPSLFVGKEVPVKWHLFALHAFFHDTVLSSVALLRGFARYAMRCGIVALRYQFIVLR